MKLKYIFSATILALAFASCSNEVEEAAGGEQSVPLQITASIDGTRAAGIEDTEFKNGEMIGLHINNTIYKAAYNGSGWDMQSGNILLTDAEKTLYAYYNGGKKEEATRAVLDKEDIALPGCRIYAGINCLVSDPVTVSAAKPVADLKFKHVMARVSFVVTRTQSDVINSMYISGDNIYTTAFRYFDGHLLNTTKGEVTLKEPPTLPVAPPTIIGSHAKDEVKETIDALLIPALAGEATITIDVNNKKYTTTVSLPELKAGGYYRLPIALEGTTATNPTHEGHEYVDLGLPSGLKWATMNVGATTPEGYGDYFAWGETEPKAKYDLSTSKWCNGLVGTITKYCTDSYYGTVDNKTVLEQSDDAASINWGGSWRMPTKLEQEELCNNCTCTWTTVNGINGYKIISNKNGNTIFLPAAGCIGGMSNEDVGYYGYYWLSDLNVITNNPFQIDFDRNYVNNSSRTRVYGLPVRAVCP